MAFLHFSYSQPFSRRGFFAKSLIAIYIGNFANPQVAEIFFFRLNFFSNCLRNQIFFFCRPYLGTLAKCLKIGRKFPLSISLRNSFKENGIQIQIAFFRRSCLDLLRMNQLTYRLFFVRRGRNFFCRRRQAGGSIYILTAASSFLYIFLNLLLFWFQVRRGYFITIHKLFLLHDINFGRSGQSRVFSSLV